MGEILVQQVQLLVGLAPRLRLLNAVGAGLAVAVISGAIGFHLFTPLGVEVQGDGGLLFTMAVGVWVAGTALIALHRERLGSLLGRRGRTNGMQAI